MAGSGLLVFILVAVVVSAVVVLIVVPRRRRLVAIDELSYPRLAKLRSISTNARIAGIALGLLAAAITTSVGRLGVGFALAPAVFGATVCLAILIGDLIAYDKARLPGSASLQQRSVSFPRISGYAVLGGLLLLAALLTYTSSVASADDMGRAGRAYRYRFECAAATECLGSNTPFPGSYYAVPLAIGIVVLLAIAAGTVLILVRRPRNGADEEVVRVDHLIRARSIESVLAAVGAAAGGSLAGIALAVTFPAANAESTGLLVTSIALCLIGIILMVWSVVLLVVPGSPAPRGARQAVLAGESR